MERYKEEVSATSEESKMQCTLCTNQKQQTLIVIKGLIIEIKLLQLDTDARDSSVNPDGSLTRLLNLIFQNQGEQSQAACKHSAIFQLFMCVLNCDEYSLECLASRFYEKTIKRNYQLEVLLNQTKDSSKTTINIALESSRTKINDSSSDQMVREQGTIAERKKTRGKKSSKTPQNQLKLQIVNVQAQRMEVPMMMPMPSRDYLMYMSMYGLPYMNGSY